jgi:hypothetical protein
MAQQISCAHPPRAPRALPREHRHRAPPQRRGRRAHGAQGRGASPHLNRGLRWSGGGSLTAGLDAHFLAARAPRRVCPSANNGVPRQREEVSLVACSVGWVPRHQSRDPTGAEAGARYASRASLLPRMEAEPPLPPHGATAPTEISIVTPQTAAARSSSGPNAAALVASGEHGGVASVAPVRGARAARRLTSLPCRRKRLWGR